MLSEEQNWTTQVDGHRRRTTSTSATGRWRSGTRFTDSDVDAGTKVVVLGQTVAEKLFGPNADPVGQAVRIKNIPFQVVAVPARKGQSPMGQDYDDAVFVPLTTFQAKIQGGLGKYLHGTIFVSATNAATADARRE